VQMQGSDEQRRERTPVRDRVAQELTPQMRRMGVRDPGEIPGRVGRISPVVIEQLSGAELDAIKPLFVELQLEEQPYFPDQPQHDAAALEGMVGAIEPRFVGENIVFAARDEQGGVAGFCWVVLFDPGTGLEGEVAEVYVTQAHRGGGIGEALVDRAVQLFRERGVTLGYVWTRRENDAATRVYRRAGFSDTEQLILTWYPV
jgi:GNAT superfamily N-acetyltransferase